MDPALSVSQITGLIRQSLELNPELQDAWVAGEVGNVTRPASGHVYFTLKDAQACLSCVMWRTTAGRYGRALTTGGAVVVHGRVSVYEPRGVYQLTADAVFAQGVGDLYQRFEALKQNLQSEGLFDRKRPLPSLPRRIGLVTSPSGAAFRDICNVLSRRYPLAEIVLAPAPVQGEDAPPAIVSAIRALNGIARIDVIIVARGGGSMEELSCFNDERVARAIYGSGIPIISGVGHEIDFTIADFVADLRAPTPSAAAELAAPDWVELHQRVLAARSCLTSEVRATCVQLGRQLEHARRILCLHSPRSRVETQRQSLDTLLYRVETAIWNRTTTASGRFDGLAGRLATLNPEATLERGYAIVTDRDTGQVIDSTGQANADRELTVRVRDGRFGAIVDRPAERPGGRE